MFIAQQYYKKRAGRSTWSTAATGYGGFLLPVDVNLRTGCGPCAESAVYDCLVVCIVVNEAPFCVAESGYGGFLLPVDIYLRTAASEPRRLRFLYDLELDSACSVACVRYEKLVFWNPAEPLRTALRRSGAVSIYTVYTALILCGNGSVPKIIINNTMNSFLPRDAKLSVCPSQVSVLLKRLNESSFFCV